MTNWTITYDTTTITIPRKPNRVEKRRSATVTTLPMIGDLPFVFSEGIEADEIVVSGILNDISKLSSLKNAVYKQVTVSGLSEEYDGTYILKELVWTEEPPNIFSYTMSFISGSELVQL